MSRIKEILAQNTQHRLDDPIPSAQDVEAAEVAVGSPFPGCYKEFVALDGLNDLRFRSQILSPSEMMDHSGAVPGFIAFAANGCGDLYCWKRGEMERVYFWDHEVGSFDVCARDFTEWLENERTP